MELVKVDISSLAALGLGAFIAVIVPIAIALIWKICKKERFTTILIGAAVFVLFAMILEKPIQNALIFPTQTLLPDHAISRFINARPVLLAFLLGLFPGVFEETGRLVAFKTVLRKRKNRETSVSYGIGHGGVEVMLILGITYIEYFVFAVIINLGIFQTLIDKVAAQAPGQIDSLYSLAAQIAGFSFADMGIGIVERIFAVLFHIGASILVFYACKDKKKFWLYPLAIILHTAMDFIAGLAITNLFNPSTWGMEGIVAVFSLLTFFGAFFLLYRKDPDSSAAKNG